MFIYNVRTSSNFKGTSKLAERSYFSCAIAGISKGRRKAKKRRARRSFLLLSNFLIQALLPGEPEAVRTNSHRHIDTDERKQIQVMPRFDARSVAAKKQEDSVRTMHE